MNNIESSVQLTEEELKQISGSALLVGYEIKELIDSGGSGIVFKATAKNGAETALKLLRRPYDDHWLRRFLREVDILIRLSHPKIVQVFAPGVMDISDYKGYAMEFIDGISLRKWLETNRPITESQAVQLLRGIGEALDYVHRNQVIHRDLHAGNVLLEGGKIECLKLVDFGTARDYSLRDLSESDGYKTFRPIGAMSHCAPEKWLNPHAVGPESDLFSVGVLIYQALTGRFPFWEDTYISLYDRIVSGKHVHIRNLRSDISEAMDDLVEYMLQPSQIFRLSNAAELTEICDKLYETRGTS